MLLNSYFIILIYLNYCSASTGDLSPFFQKCLDRCLFSNCTQVQPHVVTFDLDDVGYKYPRRVQLSLKLLRWTCKDNCKYECMWGTVDAFLNRNWDVPQFYGKWPFIRLFGIQEPASTLFSIMNLAVHCRYLTFFIKQNGDKTLTKLWNIYSLVNIHAWMWSTIFHARDVRITEMMDYISAFSIVMFSLFCAGMRLLYWKSRKLKYLFAIIVAAIFLNHTVYLSTGLINYTYNIFLNVSMGALTCLIWMMWSLRHINTQKYVWKCLLFATLVPAVSALEILDFPPFWWILDAHSLWHLATVPLNICFYSFLVDDNQYLQKDEKLEKLM